MAANKNTGIEMNASALNLFAKHGLAGLVIAVLLFFMYLHITKTTAAIESNTATNLVLNAGVQSQITTTKELTQSIHELREAVIIMTAKDHADAPPRLRSNSRIVGSR